MKIFGFNISKSSTSTVENGANASMEDLKRKDAKRRKNLQDEIRKQTLHRIKANINKWLMARRMAESIENPNNTEKERVYKDILVDSHLTAVMQTVRLLCMANSFSIYNTENNEVDEESTKLFRKMWYRNIIKEYVNSKFHGFSLVQLGDIKDGCFDSSELVPRHYVVQQKGGVKKELGNVKSLIDFKDRRFINWLVPMGDPNDLGLLDKAAPLIIKKKEVIAAWSEGAEMFAHPLRYVKTKISDVERKENAEDMMDEMGLSAWAVLDSEDEIGFLQGNRTDISNMYKAFLEFVNSEISKLFLLQTGTTDEKSHVGSAQVMQDTLKSLIESYLTDIEDLTNKTVIPIAQRHGLIPLGRYIKADNEQKLSLKELFEITRGLLDKYNIDASWISETFEIPVDEMSDEEKEVKIEKTEDIMEAVNKLYNSENCC